MRFWLGVCFLFFFGTNIAFGAPKITIIDNQRIEDIIVKSYLIDDLKDISAVNKSIKNLYSSGLFDEVEINKINKNHFEIKVSENPIINNIAFEGNKKVDNESLENEISLKKYSLLDKQKLQQDVKKIQDIYLQTGRFLAKIEPKIIKRKSNRVDLIFEISEGKKAKIGAIHFNGNKFFSDAQLKDEITTKKSKWYKFLASSDFYDKNRIAFDSEKLRRFYANHGFIDFEAISSIAQIDRLKQKFTIDFLVKENTRYKTGKISIANHIDKFDENLLKDAISLKTGKYYNASKDDDTIDKMTKIMGDNGYAFVDIKANLTRNIEEKTVDAEYVINQSAKIYINQIEILGNNRTLDAVILRELNFTYGDPYNLAKINRSRQKLQNLGFFDEVKLDIVRTNYPDKVNIIIEVVEKKTGELSFGVGYSTVDKATANIGLKERNLFGTGQELGINVQQSSRRSNNSINYLYPHFLDYDLAVGFEVFNRQVQKEDSLLFDQTLNGVGLRASYSLSEYIRHQIRYSFKSEEISNVDTGSSFTIQNLEGDFDISTIGHTISIDKRDSRFNPSNGYFASFSQDFAGIGGDIENLKHQINASYYQPFFDEKFVLKLANQSGHVDGIGQEVRSSDGFFLGGNNFRGFEFGGIGPRTSANNSAINGNVVGGKLFYVNTVELKFPNFLPKNLGLDTSVFYEFGTVKSVDRQLKDDGSIIDTGSMRSSYGFSLAWGSPVGPIRLDFSKVDKKEEFDITETFRFSIGANF